MSYRDDLKAYLDGELSAEREAEVREALESDSSLRTELEELQQLTTVFQGLPQPVPYGMENTLLALQSAKSGRRMFSTRWFLTMGLAGAGLLAIALVIPGQFNRSSADIATVAMRNEAAGSASELTKAPTVERINDVLDKLPKTEADSRARDVPKDNQGAQKPTLSSAVKPERSASSTKGSDGSRIERKKEEPKQPAGPAQAPTTAPGIERTETAAKSELATPAPAQFNVSSSEVISVESLEEAEEAVRLITQESEGLVLPEVKFMARGQTQAKSSDDKERAVVVQIPVEKVEQFTAKLKELDKRIEEERQLRNARSLQGGGFGGGAGAAAGNAQRGGTANQDSNRKTSAEPPKAPTRTIRIVLKKAKPDPTPPEGDPGSTASSDGLR